MSEINREQVFQTLFERLTTIGPEGTSAFRTTGRKLRHWTDVAPEEQPALFLAQGPEVVRQQRGLPAVHVLSASIYVYVHTAAASDPTVAPAALLNPLLDAVEDAMKPDDVDRIVCTLGGLVSHCWISGTIETSEGVLGDQEVAVVPVEILLP